MIPLHDEARSRVVARYDPDTGEVRDAVTGRLLFCYDAAKDRIMVHRAGRTTHVPMGQIRELAKVAK